MKYKVLDVLILAMGFCFAATAPAQNQTEPPAVMNPPRYGNPSAVPEPYPQNAPVQPPQTVPANLTLPAGTLVRVRLTDMLSSDRNNAGDGFTSVLEQPMIAQGWVVSQRGQMAIGRVVTAQKAGRTQGISQLAIELSELVLVDGQQIPIRTQLTEISAGISRDRDVATVGTTTGVGAVIGAVAGGGEGAAIGAAAGAAAGIVGVLSTRGRATELSAETLLTFRLEDPVTISTQESQQAFRPVRQEDFARNDSRRNPPRNFPVIGAYPSPYYYPSYYYSPYWYYGYYGYRPRIYVAPRRYFGRGFYRRYR
jgi:hypothetical protein